MENLQPITKSHLEEFGFTELLQGVFRVLTEPPTHALELVAGVDGWYPVYVQFSELSSEPEQAVHLHRVQSVHELLVLYKALSGTDLTSP